MHVSVSRSCFLLWFLICLLSSNFHFNISNTCVVFSRCGSVVFVFPANHHHMPFYVNFLKKISPQIRSLLTRFWWDANPEKKNMCWVSWDTMALPKYEGISAFEILKS